MPSRTQRIGTAGEADAQRFLESFGYRLIDRHVTCRYGEIDLIMLENDELVFVEVKRRGSSRFGTGEESLTPKKIERLVAAIETYRNAHPDQTRRPYRLDLVVLDQSGIRHLRGLAPDGTAQYQWKLCKTSR